jgi:hypothetical protein
VCGWWWCLCCGLRLLLSFGFGGAGVSFGGGGVGVVVVVRWVSRGGCLVVCFGLGGGRGFGRRWFVIVVVCVGCGCVVGVDDGSAWHPHASARRDPRWGASVLSLPTTHAYSARSFRLSPIRRTIDFAAPVGRRRHGTHARSERHGITKHSSRGSAEPAARRGQALVFDQTCLSHRNTCFRTLRSVCPMIADVVTPPLPSSHPAPATTWHAAECI